MAVVDGVGKFGVGKHGIYKILHKRGDGRRNKNTISESDIPRKVYYHFNEKSETDFPNPTFIFAYADYAATDAIFRALVGSNNDSGIARTFTIQQRLMEPIRYQKAQFLIFVELIEPHPDFLSMKEVAVLVEYLMHKYGMALSVTRLNGEEIFNI